MFNLLNHTERASNARALTNTALAAAFFLSSSIANAAILKDEKNINWVSKRDLTSTQFSQDFAKYKRQGLMMIDVDAYPGTKETLYSMIWRENTDKRGWAEKRNLTSAQYKADWKKYKDMGYRPLDIETYEVDGRRLWAGIWVENVEKWAWSSHRGLNDAEQSALFDEKTKRGYRMIDIEVYSTSSGLRYNSIWYYNYDHRNWAQLRNMTREEYQSNVDKYMERGMKVVDYESYGTPWGQRYAAIWEEKPGFAWQVRTDRTKQQFINLWYQYADEGYRLVDFERYETPQGTRYGGVWAENAERFQYEKKSQIDTLITNYRTVNNLPGISVAIIKDGQFIYRRGFGDADVANGKTANTKTVYNTASVAKVIGGTLLAKLADTQQLEDGTNFSLDITAPTSDYIAGLPAQHTHNVNELFSHLSCVGHYTTTPSIANQTTHYTNATSAMQSFWNVGLINGCNPGTAWNYSTPSFTFGGAVLESVTGKTVTELLNEEIFDLHGLTSMRVQYENNALPANSLRAVPYGTQDAVHTPGTTDFIDPPNALTNPNVASSYQDNSWKILSGGIESNTYDLARFGWKVLNAEILSATARDNLLWTRVNPAFTHGLGWSITTASGGENVAEWNGTWTGARTFLRAYQDDGLVIAIQSNRTTHRSDLNQDVDDLCNAIGNAVLN